MRKVVSSVQSRNVLITLSVTVCLYVGYMVFYFLFWRGGCDLLLIRHFAMLNTEFDS